MSDNPAPVLIIEDEEPLLKLYLLKLTDDAYQLEPAYSLKEARRKLAETEYHVVLTDIKLRTADRGGITLLEEVKKQYPASQVILFSGIAGTDEARQARRLSADGFLTKPLDFDNVRQVIRNSIALRNQLIEIYPPANDFITPDPLIYYSQPMKKLIQKATKLANRDDNVLIIGEIGTGKGLIAEGIHFGSERAVFELINCGSLSERSLGRILFGHYDEKTDIYHSGVLERLRGGTLVLDRMSGLSLPLQNLLLQALKNKRFQPSHDKSSEFSVDLRIIAIDETDLQSEVNQGLFLQELYDLVAQIRLNVPSLRNRFDSNYKDVLILAEHFIDKYSQAQSGAKAETSPPQLSPESAYILETYPFPHNVSELQKVIRLALGNAQGQSHIMTEHLPLRLQRYGIRLGLDTADKENPILCPHGSFYCDKADKIAKAHQVSKGVYLHIQDTAFELISNTIRKLGLESFPPEEIPNALTAMCHNCFPIQSSRFAIVDISKSDAQTLYAVGLLHALGVPTLLLKQTSVEVLTSFSKSEIRDYNTEGELLLIIETWLTEFI